MFYTILKNINHKFHGVSLSEQWLKAIDTLKNFNIIKKLLVLKGKKVCYVMWEK